MHHLRHRFRLGGWLTAALFGAVLSPAAARADDCTGTPDSAVMTLPGPLDQWGRIVCTPYGHVIAAREGWIWSKPGGFDPVFLPAQMVNSNPAQTGNTVYFTSIALTPVNAKEAAVAIAAYRQIFPNDPEPRRSYRLDLTSVSKRTLQVYFLDDSHENGGTSRWGIACRPDFCDPKSLFMLLDMTRPRPAKP